MKDKSEVSRTTRPRTLRCWEGGPDTEDGCGQTCMLERNHAGPHEWSRDDEIAVAIAPIISLETERKKKQTAEDAKHFAAIIKRVEHFK